MQTSPARLALIGFCYDENSSFMKGAADAPPQIRAALRSEAWNLTSENGVDLAAENTFFDAGDIESVAGRDMEMRSYDEHYELEFDSPVYISFDIDALDPAFAPGVSHREPGGLSTRQAIDLIRRTKGEIVGADIVEFNPRMDPLHITATVCAKLFKEIAAKMLSR